MARDGRTRAAGVFGGVVVALAVMCGPVWAGGEQTPPQDLARLVPPSVVVFVRATDAARLWKETKEGAFVKRLKATQVWQTFVTSDEYVKMVNARAALMVRHEFDVEQAILDVVGKEVVLAQALEATPDGGQRSYFYLLAARATSAERLAAVAEKLRAVRTETGELKSSVQHEYRGRVIYEEVGVPKHGKKAGQEQTAYYCLAADLLLLGERIGPVKAAIDRLEGPAKPSMADSKRCRETLAMLPAGCALTAYIDAAALTAKGQLGKHLAGATKNPRLAGLFGSVRKAVEAVDTVALGLRRRPATAGAAGALQVLVRARLDPEKLDPGVAALLQGRQAAHDVWRVLPTGTIAALTVRTDVARLVGFLRAQVLGPQAGARFDGIKQGLSGAFGGLDFDTDVMPALGPEMAVVFSRQPVPVPAPEGKTPRGVAATFLIQASSEGDVDTRLLTALGTLAWAGVTGNNNNPQKPKLIFGVERVGGVPLTYVDFVGEHALKGTLSPCCAKVGSFVAVSTSRAALRDFITAAGGGASLAGTPAFKRHLEYVGGKADALIYVDAKRLAAVLRENRGALVAGRKADKTEEKARADLDGLVELLGLIDGMSVTRTHTPTQVNATCTVTAAPAETP